MNNSINGGRVMIAMNGVVIGEAESIQVSSFDMVRDDVGVVQSTAFTARPFSSFSGSGSLKMAGFPPKPRSKKKRIVQKWEKKVFEFRKKFWEDIAGILL